MKGYIKVSLIVLVLLLAALMVHNLPSPSTHAAGPWYVDPPPLGNDSNDCLSPPTACATINGAIGKASSGDTIYVAAGTFPVVLLNKSVILSGGWNSTFTVQSDLSTIDGLGANRGVTVDGGVTATIERFLIRNGYESFVGGIRNDGDLTLAQTIIRNSSNNGEGAAGIYNTGVLTMTHSTVSACGIDNPYVGGIGVHNLGNMIMEDSAIRETSGVGFHNQGSLIANDSTISDNKSFGCAGISSSGSVTLTNTTVSGNETTGYLNPGGGICNRGTMDLINTTVSHNTASFEGGGIYSSGTLRLYNCTISHNSSQAHGGGIFNDTGSTLTFGNSIIAENTAKEIGPDCNGSFSSTGYNLIGNSAACNFTVGAGDLTNVAANLGPLIGTEGKPKYHPLLSDSPAINAGDPGGCVGSSGVLTTDQRGALRVGRCDIGAYEYSTPGLPACVYAFSGTPQHAAPLDTYLLPLQAAVLDSIGSPVSNTTVLFSAPVSGASATFADTGTYTTTTTTAESGIATTPLLTANALTGTFTVTATVGSVLTPAEFLLSNTAWYVAPGGNDSNSCTSPNQACATINGALGKPDIGLAVGDTILVATGTYTGIGDQVVLINKNVKLSGGWNSAFITRTSLPTIDGQNVRTGVWVNGGVTAIMERFTIRNGANSGVYNMGTLTIDSGTVISNSSAGGGGGISNNGTLTLNASEVSNNTAAVDGGGIYNACCNSTLTLNNSSVNGNKADINAVGGIYADGKVVLNNSTISRNTGNPGGIDNWGGALILNNSTVSENHFGGIVARSTVTLKNSIVAGNTMYGHTDLWGNITSAGHNIIGTGGVLVTSTGDLVNINPGLFPLIGSPAYHPLVRGSPAINAGNPTGCTDDQGNPLNTDQRGVSRVGRCDIGAYEYDPDHDPLRYIFLPIVLRQ